MEFFTNYKPDYAAYEQELFSRGVVIEAEWNNDLGERKRLVRTVSGAKKIMVYRKNDHGAYVIHYIGAFDAASEALESHTNFRYFY
jgi:hypothetical protein